MSARMTAVWGILNVTPDSFSDGGTHLDTAAAIAHGLALIEAGADIVDVGGESTRPGAEPVAEDDELRRVVPVIRGLAGTGVPISIDTSKAAVAAGAIASGAVIVNDITSLADPAMAPVVAASGSALVLMHMQGEPRTMQAEPSYVDVVADVVAELVAARDRAVAAGINPAAICLDPGIGFGKTLEHNLDLLATGVGVLRAAGHPVLVGASRKSFIAPLIGGLEPDERDPATLGAHVLAIAAGASIIRTHNVVMGLQSARVADAIVRGK